MEATTHSYRSFLLLWFGQTVSLLGTGLTNFGVGVWVFLETGSVGSLAILSLAAGLPLALLAPFAGVFVDRWNRRTAMIVSDSGSGLATVALAILFVSGNASVANLAVVVAVSSAFGALQWPAYQAATTLLVPKEQFSRAQGLMQLSDAAGRLIPPALAAVVLAVGSVSTLIAIDIATFLFAVGTLWMARIPDAPPSAVGDASDGETIFKGATFGFVYIHRRPGWRGLLGLQFSLNVAIGFFQLLIIGYVLTVSTEQALGLITSIGSAGFLLGAFVMTAWKGATSRKMLLVVVTSAGVGLMIVFFGMTSVLVAATAFLFAAFLIGAVQNSTYRALWQAKVEPDVQGRVFSARMMIVILGGPVAFILIGPLMDHVFAPLSQADTVLTPLIEGLFGNGDAAPFRMFLSFAGVGLILASIASWMYGPTRHLERDIPDFTTP